MNNVLPFWLVPLLLAFSLGSCGEAVFNHGNSQALRGQSEVFNEPRSDDLVPKPAGDVFPDASQEPEEEPEYEAEPDLEPEHEEEDLEEPQPCPKVNQNILVLDFKSGWWAGDGGNFFRKVLNGLTGECLGSVVFEYHHILRGGLGLSLANVRNEMIVVPGGATGLTSVGSSFANGAFEQVDWNKYQQIWVLSGSHSDSADIRTNAPFFQEVVARAVASKANLLIGAGFGSITHANVFGNALGLGALYTTSQTEGRILNPMAGVELRSTLKMGLHLVDHPLFARGVTSIADNMQIANYFATGDIISVSNDELDVIGFDTASRPSIGVLNIGSDRKLVLDAGLQRYYAIWQDLSEDTHKLLQNIVVYLSE